MFSGIFSFTWSLLDRWACTFPRTCPRRSPHGTPADWLLHEKHTRHLPSARASEKPSENFGWICNRSHGNVNVFRSCVKLPVITLNKCTLSNCFASLYLSHFSQITTFLFIIIIICQMCSLFSGARTSSIDDYLLKELGTRSWSWWFRWYVEE